MLVIIEHVVNITVLLTLFLRPSNRCLFYTTEKKEQKVKEKTDILLDPPILLGVSTFILLVDIH